MRKTLLLLCTVVALVLAPLSAFAQSNPIPVPCGNLSDDDCAILEGSRDAMMALSSYRASVAMDTALEDAPGLPSDLGFSFEAEGAFSLDPEINARMMELQRGDPEELAGNFAELMEVTKEFYGQSNFEMDFSFALSEGLAGLISGQAGLPLPASLSMPVRLVDGVLFFNLDDISELAGDESISGWSGVDMVAALEQTTESLDERMEADSEEMLGALSGAMAGMGSGQVMAEQFGKFVDVERLDDSEVDGVAVAQFLQTFDVAGFVASPEFIEMISSQLEQQMAMQEVLGEEPPMTQEDLDMVLELLPMLAPMMLADVEFVTVKSVGLEDLLVYSSETTVEWDLAQLAMMATAMMGAEGSRPMRGADGGFFSLSVNTRYWDFGKEIEVVAPEDARMLPIDQMSSPSM